MRLNNNMRLQQGQPRSKKIDFLHTSRNPLDSAVSERLNLYLMILLFFRGSQVFLGLEFRFCFEIFIRQQLAFKQGHDIKMSLSQSSSYVITSRD